MSIIIPANSAAGGGGYEVSNSLRFSSDTYLTNTFGSAPTLATKNTFSIWFKRSTLGTQQQLMSANNNAAGFVINSNDTIAFYNNSGPTSGQLLGPRLYRDPSAWMHFVFVFDSTQGTAANRLKAYINGVLETSFDNTGYPNQDVASAMGENGTNIKIAARNQNDRIFEGYVAETAFVDGQALGADSFGEFDSASGVWRPIDISDLTFGNNGFYLEYKQSGTGTNASGMGADTSGNNFNFAVTNLTAIDQTTDTCTNNFATLNSIDKGYGTTVHTEGNLKATSSSGWNPSRGTIAVTKGKWYWETMSGNSFQIGVCSDTIDFSNNDNAQDLTGVTVFYNASGGIIRTNGSTVGGTTATFSASDVAGFALDMDNKKLSVYKNGSIIVTNTSLSTTITDVGMIFGTTDGGGNFRINFGNPSVALDNAGVADGNGYGAFEHTPPSGYLALCTANLSEALS